MPAGPSAFPVVSGNVSLYNETNGLSIYPTPIIGMVGLIEPADRMTTQWFRNPGDRVILLGETQEDLGGTEYLKVVHYREQGAPPWLNLETEKTLHDCMLRLTSKRLVQSAHDCSDGGLAVTLAECCFSPQAVQDKPLGATIQLDSNGLRTDALLFGESPSRIVLSVAPGHAERVMSIASEHKVFARDIGTVGKDRLIIHVNEQPTIDMPVTELFEQWSRSLESKLST